MTLPQRPTAAVSNPSVVAAVPAALAANDDRHVCALFAQHLRHEQAQPPGTDDGRLRAGANFDLLDHAARRRRRLDEHRRLIVQRVGDRVQVA